MSEYQVTLLGIPGVFNNGRIVHFPYRKAEGIFIISVWRKGQPGRTNIRLLGLQR